MKTILNRACIVAALTVIGGLSACGGNGVAASSDVNEVQTSKWDLIHEISAQIDTLDAIPADIQKEYVPQQGEFLWPCDNAEDCYSGFCVPTADGGMCTMTCFEDCPTCWACVQGPTEPDPIFICVPRFAHLCDPCNENADCVTSGYAPSSLDLCLPHDLDGSFCGAECSDTLPCPGGYPH